MPHVSIYFQITTAHIIMSSPHPLVSDITVSSARLLRPRSTLTRFDILPVIIIYAILLQIGAPAIEYSWKEIPTAGNGTDVINGNGTR